MVFSNALHASLAYVLPDLPHFCLAVLALVLDPNLALAPDPSPGPGLISEQILTWYPRVVVFPGFIDEPRAKHIISLASKYMYPSGLAYRCDTCKVLPSYETYCAR